METEVRTNVVALFEKHRAVPGEAFDEAHFIDYLLPAPVKRGALHNSFRGLWRFNSFIDDVQMEFGVCFSLADRDADYSLDKFVERVVSLQRSRRGSLRSLQNQVRAGTSWTVLILADLMLFAVGSWFKNIVWLLVLVCVLGFALNAWFFVFVWRAKTYLARLKKRIEGAT